MAIFSGLHLLFISCIIATCTISIVSGTVFTLTNHCSSTVWPGILTSKGTQLGDGGLALASGSSVTLTASPGWSGRFWGRTGCNFDASGVGKCVTGDCGGKLKCAGAGGAPPATLAEFTIGTPGPRSNSVQDFYDVSLVDGYNVQMKITPQGGSGNCITAGCVSDVNAICPNELRVTGAAGVVACKSACEAFNKPEYCCTGAFSKPETCPPTSYSKIFKGACPTAYSYAYDDASSTFTCTNANYLISFCA
ncbi:PREDICTED: pathogenesis-related protein 5-like [Camelina sativa]|uniref:Pathogenesis-related protein 5-like n=1 Tax=Camelina sativa TaxID=90675 RepID=A0ABM0VQB5_CAMSA|nr:PREDICTED: pathogenesis-related protein 5-like [Camelina sativa]